MKPLSYSVNPRRCLYGSGSDGGRGEARAERDDRVYIPNRERHSDKHGRQQGQKRDRGADIHLRQQRQHTDNCQERRIAGKLRIRQPEPTDTCEQRAAKQDDTVCL